MDFEQWMDGIEANDYDDIICAMGDAFKAGQQSKQAEIDALKAKIDSVKDLSEHWHKSSGSALALNVLELLK